MPGNDQVYFVRERTPTRAFELLSNLEVRLICFMCGSSYAMRSIGGVQRFLRITYATWIILIIPILLSQPIILNTLNTNLEIIASKRELDLQDAQPIDQRWINYH